MLWFKWVYDFIFLKFKFLMAFKNSNDVSYFKKTVMSPKYTAQVHDDDNP